MSGVERIRNAFTTANDCGRTALIAYIVAGRPDVDACVDLVVDLHAAGADIIELGMPFSDPLADGPVIRRATRRALDDGIDIDAVLGIVRDVRARDCNVPIVLMGYVNPVLAYGVERFAAAAHEAGVDGLILPDLPLDESEDARRAFAAHELSITFLITPLTIPERRDELLIASTGFCYAVATTGTTGARGSIDPRAIDLLADLRNRSAGAVPIAIGFGISTSAHVTAFAPHADGVIIGSALVDRIERGDEPVRFVSELAEATGTSAEEWNASVLPRAVR
ncbi:MAG: tryptophan synthase subunit alpha [Gaiellales bacterium]